MEGKELAQEYANDLKPLRAVYSFLKDRRDNCQRLVTECEEHQAWELAEEFNAEYIDYRQRCKDIGAIISSSQYSIQWLRTKHEPQGPGVSKLPYTKREIQVDDVDKVLTLQNTFEITYPNLTEDELAEVHSFLSMLSERERDVFVSIRGKGNTHSQTARYLGISESAMYSYLRRAEEKIDKKLNNALQMSLF